MPLYEPSGIPGTGGQNSPAALRYEFQRIGEAFSLMEVTPISVQQLAGVPIPAGQVVGQLTSAQIASIQAAQITGQITGSQIASGAISGTQFASGLEPVTIVTSVPGNRLTSTIYNTTDGRLYRWQDTAYVNMSATSQLIGQLTAGQIAAGAITTTQLAAGAVTASRLAAGSVTAAAIEARSITANEIAANTLTANELAANSVTALQIAADAVTAGRIAAGAVTTATMAANSINGDRIQAGTLNANRITAGTITTDRMTANSINGDRIQAGTLNADRIQANTITADQMSATAFSADNIITRSLTIRDASGTVILSPSTLLQPAYAAPALRNDQIAVNGSGQITGIGTGNNTAVRNSLITLSGGSGTVSLNNAGGGSVSGIVMPGNPITQGNVANLIASRSIFANYIAADTITVDEIKVGELTAQAITNIGNATLTVVNTGFNAVIGTTVMTTAAIDLSSARASASGANVFFFLRGNLQFAVSPAATLRVRPNFTVVIEGFAFGSWQVVAAFPSEGTMDAPLALPDGFLSTFSNYSYNATFVNPDTYSAVRGRVEASLWVATPAYGPAASAVTPGSASCSAQITIDVRRV